MMIEIKHLIDDIIENYKPRMFPGGNAVDTPEVIEQKLWKLVEMSLSIGKKLGSVDY